MKSTKTTEQKLLEKKNILIVMSMFNGFEKGTE